MEHWSRRVRVGVRSHHLLSVDNDIEGLPCCSMYSQTASSSTIAVDVFDAAFETTGELCISPAVLSVDSTLADLFTSYGEATPNLATKVWHTLQVPTRLRGGRELAHW